MAVKYTVTGDQYRNIDQKMCKIKRQLCQKDGSSLNPAVVARQLQEIVQPKLKDKCFPVFKTIIIGIHQTKDELCQAIENAGCRITNLAHDLIYQPAFTIAEKEQEVDLVVASGIEFGLEGYVAFSQICRQAKKFNLELCPAEAGPLLRELYLDQPRGEILCMAMKPICGLDDNPSIFSIFSVGCSVNGSCWLDDDSDHFDFLWSTDIRWVFCRQRQ